MDQLFPHANMVAGLLVLVVGFGFHFVGQLYSVLNWERAAKLGLQEQDMPPEYEVYERAIATADTLVGWTYGVAAVGLFLDAAWGYVWAWIPGAILTYHALSFWFWTSGQQQAGYDRPFTRRPGRQVWFVANLVTGLLAIAVAASRTTVL